MVCCSRWSSHESSASTNDRQRQQAVDAALAGLVVADSALSRNASYAGSGLVAFAGGSAEFEVTVSADPTSVTGFGRLVTSVGYAPTKAGSLRAVRTVVQAIELQPVGFTYAVFSETSILTGSSSTVIGDVYTNGDLRFGNSQDYIGNIYVRGDLSTGSNQKITGNVYANGNVVVTSSSTTVYGSAFALGNVVTGGTIRDNAQAGGNIGCTKVLGTCIQNSPPPPVPLQHLPAFVWNPANYPSVTTYASGAAFIAARSKTASQGTFFITGDVLLSKQDALWLSGDMTIVATGDISLPGSVANTSTTGANVQLSVISTGGGRVTPANNFTIPASVTTLVFTTGIFDAKNSSTFRGVLYAGEVSSGAHMSITHELPDRAGLRLVARQPADLRHPQHLDARDRRSDEARTGVSVRGAGRTGRHEG